MKGCICHFVKWQIHSFISKAQPSRLILVRIEGVVFHIIIVHRAFARAVIFLLRRRLRFLLVQGRGVFLVHVFCAGIFVFGIFLHIFAAFIVNVCVIVVLRLFVLLSKKGISCFGFVFGGVLILIRGVLHGVERGHLNVIIVTVVVLITEIIASNWL